MRRFLRLGLCAVLAVIVADCGTTSDAGTPEYELADLTDAYVAFFDRTQGLATEARVAAFKAEMGVRFPGFYDAARMPGMTPERYNANIARSFTDFPQRRQAFIRTAASFQSMLRPAIDSFVGTFRDFRNVGHIALLHSLGEMDAGTRSVSGQSYLVFGADVMATLYAPGKERPFFHHELFHVYNGQFFGECDPLWCALWMEGLAVYVSEQLNPGVTDADLLLTSPRPIRAAVDAHLARCLCNPRAARQYRTAGLRRLLLRQFQLRGPAAALGLLHRLSGFAAGRDQSFAERAGALPPEAGASCAGVSARRACVLPVRGGLPTVSLPGGE